MRKAVKTNVQMAYYRHRERKTNLLVVPFWMERQLAQLTIFHENTIAESPPKHAETDKCQSIRQGVFIKRNLLSCDKHMEHIGTATKRETHTNAVIQLTILVHTTCSNGQGSTALPSSTAHLKSHFCRHKKINIGSPKITHCVHLQAPSRSQSTPTVLSAFTKRATTSGFIHF